LKLELKKMVAWKKRYGWVGVILGVLYLSACNDDKSIDRLLQTVHATMLRQDSIMKAAHDKLNKKHVAWHAEYEKALQGRVDSLHLKLEKAHEDLLEKHDDIIGKHELILKMHKRLIEKFQNGRFDNDFIEEEHRLLEEEHELMRLDHEQLLVDHDKLEKDHIDWMAALNKNIHP
jgi:hypothetical protein